MGSPFRLDECLKYLCKYLSKTIYFTIHHNGAFDQDIFRADNRRQEFYARAYSNGLDFLIRKGAWPRNDFRLSVPGYIAVARKRRLVAEVLGPSLVLVGRLADLAPRSAKVFRGCVV